MKYATTRSHKGLPRSPRNILWNVHGIKSIRILLLNIWWIFKTFELHNYRNVDIYNHTDMSLYWFISNADINHISPVSIKLVDCVEANTTLHTTVSIKFCLTSLLSLLKQRRNVSYDSYISLHFTWSSWQLVCPKVCLFIIFKVMFCKKEHSITRCYNFDKQSDKYYKQCFNYSIKLSKTRD